MPIISNLSWIVWLTLELAEFTSFKQNNFRLLEINILFSSLTKTPNNVPVEDIDR